MEEEPNNKSNNNKKKKTNKNWFLLIGFVLIIGAIVLLLWFLMRGETKTTGGWSEETSESLTCKASNIDYRYFGTDKAPSSNNVQINAIFNNDKLQSISLVRKMTYADAETAKIWSDAHEFYLNDHFGKNGLDFYSFNANFSKNDNVAQMSLYATNSEINDTSIKYFMLDSAPKNIDGYKKAYIDKGFKCEIVKK